MYAFVSTRPCNKGLVKLLRIWSHFRTYLLLLSNTTCGLPVAHLVGTHDKVKRALVIAGPIVSTVQVARDDSIGLADLGI